jgi:tRNA (guanine37-N1)-methyltransferase
LLEAPSFTKPVEFRGLKIPSELSKGNHAKIRNLKIKLSKYKTKYFRP